MSTPLLLACIWALVATGTALLPLRAQMVPGLTLLVTAPVLIVWIGMEHGWIWVAVAVAAFVSMFRRPLVYLVRKAMGHDVEDPRP